MGTTVWAILGLVLCGPSVLSAQEKDIRGLAGAFGDALSKLPKRTVAVVDFNDPQGNVTELGRYLAEQVPVALATTDKGIAVVDRTHLKALIQENKLNSTGLMDPATARKLGQIAGVEALITGTLTPFGDSVQLDVKALDSATARIVTAATIHIAKTKAIEELLGRGIQSSISLGSAAVTGVPQVGPSGGNPNPTSPQAIMARFDDGKSAKNRFEAESCGRRANTVVCVVTVTSQGIDGGIDIRFRPSESQPCRAIDARGREYFMKTVQLGGQSANEGNPYVRNQLTADVLTQVVIGFEDVPDEVTLFRLLEIAGYDYAAGRYYKASIKNIAVTMVGSIR